MPLIASSPYANILSGIGLLKDGKASPESKEAFIKDVETLISSGNEGGKNGSKFIAFPPVGGPFVPAAGTALFWFAPTPGFNADILRDEQKSQLWHKIFIETLYSQTLTLLDFAGNTPLFPLFDPSAPFGVELDFPFTPPQLISALKTTPPKFLAKLAGAGIKLSVPKIPVPTIPNIMPQSFTFNSDGTIKKISVSANPPNPKLPALVTGLVKMPVGVLTSLLVPPDLSLVYDIPGLPKTIAGKVFDAFQDLLKSIGFDGSFIPKEFLASIIVYLKNVIALICVVIVGSILGTGNITLKLAVQLGLLEK